MRSLLKNSSYLGASKAVAAVCAIATLAMAGRALGLESFGLLVLIASYAQAASGLSKFQSWQLIIRYGGPALARQEPEDFTTATNFALGLDFASGFIGMVAAMALLPLIGTAFGIPDDYVLLAILYCTLLPTMGAATPVGVLRALDRFDLISWQGTSYPIARAVLTLIAWQQELPFTAFVAIWYLTDLGGDLFLWFLAWRELRRRKLLGGIRPRLSAPRLHRPWQFAISVNLTTSLNAAMGPIGRLIVGGLLGPAGAALYRVAGSLANSAQKPADLLAKAFYPEVARLDLTTRAPWRLMTRSILLSIPIGGAAILIVLLAGRWILDALFGGEFVAAYPVLVVMIGAAVLAAVTFPLPSMLLALGRPNDALVARVAGVLCFLGSIVPLSQSFGVAGAGAAFVLGNAIWVLVMAVQLWFAHKRVRAA